MDFGHPGRVAGEQIVIFGRAQETDDAQLDDEIVDDFLRLFLGHQPGFEVALEIDVEEGRDAAQRHGRAVLLLHAGEVAEIEPLHGFLRGGRRSGNVEAVFGRHFLELAERADLFAQFLAVADDLVGRPFEVERRLLVLLALDQPVDAVERDPAIVADDPPAAIGVGQAGQDVPAAAAADVGGVGVEHSGIVGLAIFGEDLDDLRVGLEAVRLEAVGHHLQAAVGHDRPLQRRLGLQADDDLIVLVDVAGVVRGDRARDLRDVEHALLALLDEQVGQLLPDRRGALGRAGEERLVAIIGRVVLLDEVADVDLLGPQAWLEVCAIAAFRLGLGLENRRGHWKISVLGFRLLRLQGSAGRFPRALSGRFPAAEASAGSPARRRKAAA